MQQLVSWLLSVKLTKKFQAYLTLKIVELGKTMSWIFRMVSLFKFIFITLIWPVQKNET